MPGGDMWIVVPKWDTFQHYPDRNPVWIKLYAALNSDDEWLHLSCAARGLLVTIWVEFARSNGQLRAEVVQRLCGPSAREKHWEALNHAGLIQLSASKPSSNTRSREKNLEEKKKELKGPLATSKKPKNQRAAENWMRNTGREVPLTQLADVIADEFPQLDPAIRQQLVEHAKSAR